MTLSIQYSVSLKYYTTFGTESLAKIFCEIGSEKELQEISLYPQLSDPIILSGGSNTIFVSEVIERPVLYLNIQGKQVIDQSDNTITLRVTAGEDWIQFVHWAVENNWGGAENLTLIPSRLGGAVVQNIGAYGVEFEQICLGCTAYDPESQTLRYFTHDECEFGYRHSIFKTPEYSNHIITSVDVRLTTKDHIITTEYPAVSQILAQNHIPQPTIQDLARIITEIRTSKLPDPKQIGNSGSFFKNPIIPETHYHELIKQFPDMPSYPHNDKYKIPAGWLIEYCGHKGKTYGNIGVYHKQALVLTNATGKATGPELLRIVEMIQNDIRNTFGINLEPEVLLV